MEKITMSHEDYLEAIIMLGGSTEQTVRSVDIAKQMGVSKASVNKAIGLLKEKGFVEQSYYGAVSLTEAGNEYGKAVYKRHRYLTAFLSKGLGISEDVAEDEACLMEHAISDDSFEKWVAFIEKQGYIEDPE